MLHLRRLSAFVLLAVCLFPCDVRAQVSAPVDVAVYMDDGAWEDGVIAFEHFLDWKGLSHERVDAAAVNAAALHPRFRSIYFPGGYAYDYKRKITNRGEKNIRDLVDAGGAYIGICAGAYFAADRVEWEEGSYPYTLGLFKGAARGALDEIAAWPEYTMTTITTNPGHPVTTMHPGTFTTLYFGGPAFIPDPDFRVDTLATWDASGNTPAIVAFARGAGRVLLVGPHPEIEENDNRDGTLFGSELSDPESEWGFLSAATDWVLQEDSVTTTVENRKPAPGNMTVSPAWPNPAADRCFITLSLASPSRTTVALFDLLGRHVATMMEGDLPAGSVTLELALSPGDRRLSPGMYFVRLYNGEAISATQTLFVH